MARWVLFSVCLLAAGLGVDQGGAAAPPAPAEVSIAQEEKKVIEWRKQRDELFKSHQRSPLTDREKKRFKGLTYYPFDSRCVVTGTIERFAYRVDDPRYYATFVTNTGMQKRYVRYGKFQWVLFGNECALEIFKSILGDSLFIPFKDRTNGNGTYGAGRYVDAEVLPGYRIVLDFNMAYFPYCAYNEKFVCALPPKENTLNVEVRAGEKNSK